MSALGGRNGFYLAGLALILASTLVFLYVKTQGSHTSSHFETVSLLRQLKHLDARWESEVLMSKVGISTSYDSLVDPIQEFSRLQEKLWPAIQSSHPEVADLWANAAEAFHRATEDRNRLTEQFKSHNSVLRNSLLFLPTAAGM